MSPVRHRRSRRPDFFRRLFAAGCVGLVLTLSVFAASPILHQELHKAAHSRTDDGCAIVLFAGGVSVPLTVPTLVPPSAEWREQRYIGSADLLVASPRYLLPPEHGPPAT